MADRAGLPFEDTADFEDAERGLVDAGEPVIRNEAGKVVWDNGSYSSFLTGDAPESVHPSLWRQSMLVAKQGLFGVTDGIYQVRGYDLSNMSVIEGDTGIIVIDPLISAETAAAALALYREHRGDRPVVAVIHTHSHVDHFGGVKGVVSQDEVDAGRVQIIAQKVSWNTRSRRTSMPGRQWRGARATCTAPRWPGARAAGWERAWARPPRLAPSR
jgi:alkyl sulfatase BDS1-like metallo-beta-lactamase superfamily hydrolase